MITDGFDMCKPHITEHEVGGGNRERSVKRDV